MLKLVNISIVRSEYFTEMEIICNVVTFFYCFIITSWK